MDKKQLRRLSRRDLLELLVDMGKENEQLRARNQELETRLNQRSQVVASVGALAGSLADASLHLNSIFQAAQVACDQYIRTVQQHAPVEPGETENVGIPMQDDT